MKKNKLMVILPVVLISFLFAGTALALPIYSGSLSGSGGGIAATDGWNNSTTVLSWTITDLGVLSNSNNEQVWKYEYSFSGDYLPSYILIEVSSGSTASDFWGTNFGVTPLGITPATQVPGSGTGGNVNMPGNLYSLSFPSTSSIIFTSTFAPEWGDFYSRDGRHPTGGAVATAYDTGFTVSDVDDSASNILRPGSIRLVPEPATMLLLGLGLVGLAGFRRRMK